MSSIPTQLDLISSSQSQKEITANALFDAASPATLFGRRASTSTGLTWGYYGGAFWNGTTLTIIANGTVALTASATNYVYATAAGVVTVVTSAPTGWPSALATGLTPLYQLTVGTTGPTAGTDYRVAGSNLPPTTITNIVNTTVVNQSVTSTGQPNLGLIRWQQVDWFDSSNFNGNQNPGGSFVNTGSPGVSVSTQDWSSIIKSITRGRFISSSVAGTSISIQGVTQIWALSSTMPTGGGFNLTMAAGIEVLATGMRSLYGMYHTLPTNADPSSFLNFVGFGADTGDTNLQFMRNDGSGTATKIDLGANFPARSSAADFYLMRINAAPGQTGSIDYAITNYANSGSVFTASGTVASDLPAANTFLGPIMWWNNAATTGAMTVSPSRMLIQSNW